MRCDEQRQFIELQVLRRQPAMREKCSGHDR
jgi:hypothetical protein